MSTAAILTAMAWTAGILVLAVALAVATRPARQRMQERRAAAARAYGETVRRACADERLAQLDDDLSNPCPWCTDSSFPYADHCNCATALGGPCGRLYCKAAEAGRG